jgi:hypothetical protein
MRNPLSNVAHASDVVASVLHSIAERDSTPKQFIKTHPGKGHSTLKFGMPRLLGRASEMGMSDEALQRIEEKATENYVKGAPLCESPIERSMLAALLTGDWGDMGAVPPALHDSSRTSTEMLPKCPVVIAPQLALIRFRLDFGIIVAKAGRMQIVAVECDGHDFHQDAIKESMRVAYLNSWDIPVFKFTGSELHDDAIRAADKVITGIHGWWAE